MKNRIRLTESDLHRIVKNTLRKVLRESGKIAINEERNGLWDQYRLRDFARDVLLGEVGRGGTIDSYVSGTYRYVMKGSKLKIKFPEFDGGSGYAKAFIERDAEDYPEYKFTLDPSDEDDNTMIVRCKYDEYWGR